MAKPTRLLGPREPVHIFNDDCPGKNAPMTCHAPMPAVTKPPRRPLAAASSNVHLSPPPSNMSARSPHKPKSSSPRSPLKSTIHGPNNKMNFIPMAPPTNAKPATDSLKKKPRLSNFKTGSQRRGPSPPLFSSKENVRPPVLPAPPVINLSIDNNFYQKPNSKRSLMDPAPIKDARGSKKTKLEEVYIPHPESFPPIQDDGSKPPHSYAQLIGMAILRSPLRRLTLAQIYKWISDNYSFYNPNDAGWQNSIRHNLSLHKNFIKIERPKDDPGKGNYWGIEPGTEFQFLRDRAPRKSTSAVENLPVMSTRLEPSQSTPAPPLLPETSLPLPNPLPAPSLLPPPVPLPMTMPPTALASVTVPTELSSDATIPVSDGITLEESVDKTMDPTDAHPEPLIYSPLPANMHSTPPVPKHPSRQNGTPPSAIRKPTSSGTRSHNRRFNSLDDSGYISSLDSSVMRPNQKALLTSEADRPRLKRGRAEEEIARLRGSSPFSPTKSRSLSAFGPVSSSPVHQANESQMLPPLTPVVKMLPPANPPPSVSPNTNLRIHRDKVRHMLQSPLRRLAGDETIPWSPAFSLEETLYSYDDVSTTLNHDELDIFQEVASMDYSVFRTNAPTHSGSPIKRSTKRLRIDRSVSTSAIGDVVKSAKKAPTPVKAGLLKMAEPSSSSHLLGTPSKALENFASPSKLFNNLPAQNASPSKMPVPELPVDGDWPGLLIDPSEFLAPSGDQCTTDFSGLDILQGFERIGSGSSTAANKPAQISKPSLGRSFTSGF